MNEEQFQKARKKFFYVGLVGAVVALCGLIMAIIGFAGFFKAAGDLDNSADFGKLALGIAGAMLGAIGLGAMAFGFVFSFGRSFGSYQASMMRPVYSSVARSIAGGIKESKDVESELTKLDELKAKKLITEEEYKQMRTKALGINEK